MSKVLVRRLINKIYDHMEGTCALHSDDETGLAYLCYVGGRSQMSEFLKNLGVGLLTIGGTVGFLVLLTQFPVLQIIVVTVGMIIAISFLGWMMRGKDV